MSTGIRNSRKFNGSSIFRVMFEILPVLSVKSIVISKIILIQSVDRIARVCIVPPFHVILVLTSKFTFMKDPRHVYRIAIKIANCNYFSRDIKRSRNS